MKKIFIFAILTLLILPSIFAIDLEIEKQSSNEVLISDLKTPALFDLSITNLGKTDTFKIYNLLGFDINPKTITINQGETKNITLEISQRRDLGVKGFYIFHYFIKGKDESKIDEKLTAKIIELKEAFEIGSEEFDSESGSLNIYIKNNVNLNFNETNIKFKSAFFELEETFSLAPYEKKSFNVQLDKEDFKRLMAGFYTLNAEISVKDKKTDLEGTIKFVEKSLLTTTKKDYGLVIYTKIIEKINEGNVVSKSETTLKKNIISRLFTSFDPQPDVVERQGATIYYSWNREIKPGESLKILVKTNWFFPLLIILFIVTIVVLAKQYARTNLVLKKKVSFVQTKNGEFALKISIIINSKKYIEKVKVMDKLPPLTQLHERFGVEKPVRVYRKERRIEWEFEKLEVGETRVLSYIVYSKIGMVGKFSLPTTTAIYEKEGEIHEAKSNRAFFIVEQKVNRNEDD